MMTLCNGDMAIWQYGNMANNRCTSLAIQGIELVGLRKAPISNNKTTLPLAAARFAWLAQSLAEHPPLTECGLLSQRRRGLQQPTIPGCGVSPLGHCDS
jgi:hypothetical protein